MVTSRGAVATRRSGSTTVRKAYLPEAPSTYAASFRSFGIAVSAPEQTRKKYGKPHHRLTISTENLARLGSVSQGTSAPSTWLMKPKSVLSIAFQTSALRMNGIPKGTISSSR